METASLDDFTALNDQLAALVEAGVPLDMGLASQEIPIAKELDRINSTVARRVKRGETLNEALEGDVRDVPAAYRSLMQLSLQTGNLTAALDDSSRVAESVDDSRFTLETAFLYPLIVCFVAYLGLIGYSLFLVPTLEAMYRDVFLEPRWGFRVFIFIRETLPFWIAIPPIVLLTLIFRLRRSRSRRNQVGIATTGPLQWLPGVSQILFQERCARFAASLSELLAKKVALHESLPIAGDASGDASLADGAKLLASEAQAGALPPDDSAAARRFPPFLRWAIWHSEETTGREQALAIASRMYREAAARRAERLRTLAPMVVLVLLGGTVTLFYALALFVPIIDLLIGLSK